LNCVKLRSRPRIISAGDAAVLVLAWRKTSLRRRTGLRMGWLSITVLTRLDGGRGIRAR
jgi:hypothetical protein